MSRYIELKNARTQFLEITGIPVEEFEKYLPDFGAAYYELYPSKTMDAQPLQNSDHSLARMEDKLLLIWMHHQTKMGLPVLGSQFGLSPSQADDWIQCLAPVLQLTFARLTVPRLPIFCIQFLQALNTYQVEYLIVGGYAVAFHGYHRPILDLDIFIATDLQNAQKMVRALQACGGGVAPQVVDFFQTEQRVIRIGLPPFSMERSDRGDRFIQLGNAPSQSKS